MTEFQFVNLYSIAVSDSGTTRLPVPKSNGKMTVKLIGIISGKMVLLRCESIAGLFVYLCLTMKRLYLIITFLSFSLLGFSKEYNVYGPQGGLAMDVKIT